MFNPANLDEREQLIYSTADTYWATRFCGRGRYDRLGPFNSELAVVQGIEAFFRNEEQNYPPPATIYNRPFAVYASSPNYGEAHVIIGNIYRDGVKRVTHKEVSQRVQEERASAKRKRSSSNKPTRPT